MKTSTRWERSLVAGCVACGLAAVALWVASPQNTSLAAIAGLSTLFLLGTWLLLRRSRSRRNEQTVAPPAPASVLPHDNAMTKQLAGAVERANRVQRRLDLSESIRQVLLEEAAGPLLVVDRSWKVIDSNMGAREELSLSASELVGRPLSEVIPGSFMPHTHGRDDPPPSSITTRQSPPLDGSNIQEGDLANPLMKARATPFVRPIHAADGRIACRLVFLRGATSESERKAGTSTFERKAGTSTFFERVDPSTFGLMNVLDSVLFLNRDSRVLPVVVESLSEERRLALLFQLRRLRVLLDPHAFKHEAIPREERRDVRHFDLHTSVMNSLRAAAASIIGPTPTIELAIGKRVPRHVFGDDILLEGVLVSIVLAFARSSEEDQVWVSCRAQEAEEGQVRLQFEISDASFLQDQHVSGQPSTISRDGRRPTFRESPPFAIQEDEFVRRALRAIDINNGSLGQSPKLDRERQTAFPRPFHFSWQVSAGRRTDENQRWPFETVLVASAPGMVSDVLSREISREGPLCEVCDLGDLPLLSRSFDLLIVVLPNDKAHVDFQRTLYRSVVALLPSGCEWPARRMPECLYLNRPATGARVLKSLTQTSG